MLSDLVKRALYSSGALGLYHRLRNRQQLTVVMFHRVLDPADARWSASDPDYTLSTELFAESLAFLRRHYSVVSVDDVLRAHRDGAPLPPRPLLITFDDGWADNVDYALPALERAGLPALLFVVADAVGARQPFFQERIYAAWRRGVIGVEDLVAALRAVGHGIDEPGTDERSLRAVIACIEALEPEPRARLLATFAAQLDDGLRHMVDADDLRRLQAHGVALGLHGKTHTPMTRAADLDGELSGARAALAAHLGADAPAGDTLSFPHGAHDRAIAERAHASGYALAFTSVPVLNPVAPRPGWLLGRTGFDTRTVVDAAGRFRPDRLALYLFRKERRVLA